MKSGREPIWWIPLVRRVVRWGAATAIIVNALPSLIVAYFIYAGAFHSATLAPDTAFWDGVVLCLFFASIFTCPLALAGAIIGWVSGFLAPSSEPINPLKSSFLRITTTQTLGIWFVSCVFIGAGLSGIYLLFFNRPPSYWRLTPFLMCIVLGIAFLLFALSLWRAINLASRRKSNA